MALADPDANVRTARAADWGIGRVFDSAAALLAASDLQLDAVDVACPREHHADAVQRAVAAGLAVFCQKPLAPTWNEARALVDGLPAGARLMVHENWRYRPHYRLMCDWIAAGRIGQLREVTVRVCTSGLLPDAGGCLPALQRQPMLGGLDRMLLMEVMIHHIDALRMLVGDMTLLGAVIGSDTDCLRGEDRASLLFNASGAAVSLIGDFRAHGTPGALSDAVTLQGTDGAISLAQDRLKLFAGTDVLEDVALDLAADYAASYRDAIAVFLDAIEAGDTATFAAQVEDNLRTLDLVEQAYASPAPRFPLVPGG